MTPNMKTTYGQDNYKKILNKKTTELTNTKESKIPSENSLLC